MPNNWAMRKFAQVQFPPMRKLERLAMGEDSPDLEVFEYLTQLSPNWANLWTMASAWDELIEKERLRGLLRLIHGKPESGIGFTSKQTKEDNRRRFFELCCQWMRRNYRNYFQTLVVVAETISRLAIPEPLSTTVSITKRVPRDIFGESNLTYRLCFRRWSDQKVFVAQAADTFEESEELTCQDMTDFMDLTSHLRSVKKALSREEPELSEYTGYWRRPQHGVHSKYSEHWIQFVGNGRATNRFTGHVVIDLLHRLAHKQSAAALDEFEKFLGWTMRNNELKMIYDWACEQDGRIILQAASPGRLTGRYQARM